MDWRPPWGEEYMPGGKPMANIWQGEFPWQNLLEDGFEWTAPVGSFPPNGYRLFDMAGSATCAKPPRNSYCFGKIAFQSSFMLTTVHFFATAMSSALSSLPTCEVRS